MKKNNISIVIPKYKPNKEIFKKLKIYLKENAKGCEIIEIPGLNGLANAYNKGIKKSKGEIIITLHQDCIPLEKNSLKKLVKPFEDKKVVISCSWILEKGERKKYYPFIPDGKFTAYRKSSLKKVGLFDAKKFFVGGEDVDIYLKLKNSGKFIRVETGVLHVHPGYKTKKSLEKIKQNGNINGALFRVWGFKYPKWFKAIILTVIYPKTYGKEFLKAFFRGKQTYRRVE